MSLRIIDFLRLRGLYDYMVVYYDSLAISKKQMD